MLRDQSIADRLRVLRKSHGISSRHSVAKDLGVPYTTYCNWEQGKCYPPLGKIPEIAKYYKLTVDELLNVNQDSVISDMAIKLASLAPADREAVERIIDSLIANKKE